MANMNHGKAVVQTVTYSDNSVQTTANLLAPLKVKTVIGHYTLSEQDVTENWMIRIYAAYQNVAFVTLPTLNVPDGSTFIISAAGLGNVEFIPNGSVVINSPKSLIIERKYGRGIFVKVGNDIWDVDGQLAAL